MVNMKLPFVTRKTNNRTIQKLLTSQTAQRKMIDPSYQYSNTWSQEEFDLYSSAKELGELLGDIDCDDFTDYSQYGQAEMIDHAKDAIDGIEKAVASIRNSLPVRGY